MSNEWKKFGSVRVGKTAGNYYMKIDTAITLSPNDAVFLQDPRKKLKESVAAGRLTEERATELSAKIPEYIKYDLVLAPAKKV